MGTHAILLDSNRVTRHPDTDTEKSTFLNITVYSEEKSTPDDGDRYLLGR